MERLILASRWWLGAAHSTHGSRATTLTQHKSNRVRKDACWALSNIAAGTPEQARTILEAQAVPSLVDCLTNGEFRVRKEACFCLRNLVDTCSDSEVEYIVSQGVIPALVDVLSLQDVAILEQALSALHRVLKAAAAAVPVGSPNACAEWIEECGGVDTIEQLQQHENDAVYELALGIVEEFFSEEEEEVADMAPQATSSGFAFAAPTQHTQFAL